MSVDLVSLANWVGRPLLEDRVVSLRLFCFPYAGGGASVFREWPRELAPGIEVCPLQLPGRESRWLETAFSELPSLISQLTDVIVGAGKVPFALFGHSMGALIAYELARDLCKRGVRGPVRLFASGARAPHIPERHPPLHELPDPELLLELKALKGVPDAILCHDEVIRLLLPALRADLTLCEAYKYQPESPLLCPISAYGGTEDPRVSAEEVLGWSTHTTSSFRPRFFAGGHFFINSARTAVLEVLAEEATEILATEGKCGDGKN